MIVEAWFLYAFSAAILWGLSYSISEHVLKAAISPSTILLIYSVLGVPVYGFIAWKNGSLLKSTTIMKSDISLFLLTGFIVICYITANFLIFKSIGMKNAGLASLIEISYPLFTIFFTWAIFKDIQLNIGTAFGALLVMSGIIAIYKFS